MMNPEWKYLVGTRLTRFRVMSCILPRDAVAFLRSRYMPTAINDYADRVNIYPTMAIRRDGRLEISKGVRMEYLNYFVPLRLCALAVYSPIEHSYFSEVPNFLFALRILHGAGIKFLFQANIEIYYMCPPHLIVHVAEGFSPLYLFGEPIEEVWNRAVADAEYSAWAKIECSPIILMIRVYAILIFDIIETIEVITTLKKKVKIKGKEKEVVRKYKRKITRTVRRRVRYFVGRIDQDAIEEFLSKILW